jgi:hypothetical protein
MHNFELLFIAVICDSLYSLCGESNCVSKIIKIVSSRDSMLPVSFVTGCSF